MDFRRLNLPGNLAEQYAGAIVAALSQMRDVESGVEVNYTERRQVGHYWLRSPDNAPDTWCQEIHASHQLIQDFVDKYRNRFRKFLLIGIGGSALGPQFLDRALRIPGQTPAIHFLDNTDPEGFVRTFREIDIAGGLEDTLTLVISKSGKTPETVNGMKVARHAYQSAGLPFERHAIAITEPGSELDRLAANWLQRFPVWEWVGGRTSLFSPVGLVPAALLGFDWRLLLAGAREMDETTGPANADAAANPALRLALAWRHLGARRDLTHQVVLPYSDRLSLLASYLQQLMMESLGKQGQGITVFGNKGSTDQHSYVQQLIQGRPDFFVAFVRVLCPRSNDLADIEVDEGGIQSADFLAAFQDGTARALAAAGRPSFRLTIEGVSERTVGAVVALFERAVGYYAAMIGINAYDQPGVEGGKKAATGYLDAQRALVQRVPTFPAKPASVTELIVGLDVEAGLAADILNRLALNHRFGIARTHDGETPRFVKR